MGNYLMVLIALISPTSHHSISMASTSINDLLIINVNYFVMLANCNVMVQGLKNVLVLAASDMFQPVFLGHDKVVPPLSMSTDADMLEYVCNITTTPFYSYE